MMITATTEAATFTAHGLHRRNELLERVNSLQELPKGVRHCYHQQWLEETWGYAFPDTRPPC